MYTIIHSIIPFVNPQLRNICLSVVENGLLSAFPGKESPLVKDKKEENRLCSDPVRSLQSLLALNVIEKLIQMRELL